MESLPKFDVERICKPIDLTQCLQAYPFLEIFQDPDLVSNAYHRVFDPSELSEHSRHKRGLPEDIFLAKAIAYILNFTILQLKGYVIKSIFLTVIYILFMPIVNVVLVQSGLLPALAQYSVNSVPPTPIQPPTSNSGAMELFAWQVYHSIKDLGDYNPNNFIFL